jgi:AcrR family transcriptional regulator
MMSVAVINYDWCMVRWEPDSRGRLEQAAMALYSEQGFEKTTVAEIAERAGVTERTFFRHFADKREVLFSGAGEFQELIVGSVARAPESLTPIDAAAQGLLAAAELLQGREEFARQRAKIISANAELLERELIKFASLSVALTDTLRDRGVTEPTASLTSEVALAVFRSAFERWIGGTDGRDFPQIVRESLDELTALTARR